MMPQFYRFIFSNKYLQSNVLIFLNGDAHPPESKNKNIPHTVSVAHYFDYLNR